MIFVYLIKMNTTFKCNVNAEYSTKDLKGGYNSNNFSLLNVYLDEKGTSVKIQLPNIFKDHHIIAKPKHKIADGEWPLSLVLNHPNLLVRTVYRFHAYFHLRLILHKLHISLPHEDGFSKKMIKKLKMITRTVHITVYPMSMA